MIERVTPSGSSSCGEGDMPVVKKEKHTQEKDRK